MKTAVIYARYSSDRQTEQSIEGQLRVCHEYAERNNIAIIDTYIDRAMTGTNDNRTSFQKMIKDSDKRAWDYVLVYKIDRFSRNKYETAMHKKTLRDNGIKLLSAMENIPDTPEGIILESLLEGMAEYYSAELSQKVKRGMNESRLKGQFTGGKVLFGYKVENKKLLIDEDEAAIVKFIFEKSASGMYVTQIVDTLNSKGIQYRGTPFKINSVHNFLRNEKYTGVCRHNEQIFKNIYPTIITPQLFNIVKQRLAANHYGNHGGEIIYLLKNKIKCGYCGNVINSSSGTGRSGKVMRYYTCVGRRKLKICTKTPIRKEILEQVVIDTTLKMFANQENLNLLVDKILETHNKRLGNVSIINLLQKDKHETEMAISNLVKSVEQGLATTSTKERLEQLEKKLININEKLVVENTQYKTQLSKQDIIKYIKSSLKKEPAYLLDLMIKRIILFDDKIEIYYNYTNEEDTIDDRQGCPLFYDNFKNETLINNFGGIQTFRVIDLNIEAKI